MIMNDARMVIQREMFAGVKKEIFTLLERDSFKRFIFKKRKQVAAQLLRGSSRRTLSTSINNRYLVRAESREKKETTNNNEELVAV